MSRLPSRWLLRTPAQITIWLLLLLVTLGPQHSLLVCTMGCCNAPAPAATEEVADGCPCCSGSTAGRETEDTRTPGNRALCRDCCLDLALMTEVGPLPKPVGLPDSDPPCVAMLPDEPAGAEGLPHGALTLHCTGLPRADARTALIATTNLRL